MQDKTQTANEFKVSVIIPVYNAEKFIRAAVESVLIQAEVGEIILIEDKSPDGVYEICKQLEAENSLIKVYTHPNHQNRGAGMSRNLGISKATCPFIAFLDADDLYLPDRFKTTKVILLKNSDADGVYEAVGVKWNSPALENAWKKAGKPLMTTLSEKLSAELLFENMAPIGGKGWFHANGLTVRKSIFSKVNVFGKGYVISEDTDLFMRMALLCKLLAGNIQTPVALRGVHDDNRVANDKILFDRAKVVFSVLKAGKHVLNNKQRELLLAFLFNHIRVYFWTDKNLFQRKLIMIQQIIKVITVCGNCINSAAVRKELRLLIGLHKL